MSSASDLDGKSVGVVRRTCTYDTYLQGSAGDRPGRVRRAGADRVCDHDPTIKTYDTDSTAIRDLALGDGRRLDGAISVLPTLQAAIDAGTPIKIVGQDLYYEPLAVAIDRSSGSIRPASSTGSRRSSTRCTRRTLEEASAKWYGTNCRSPRVRSRELRRVTRGDELRGGRSAVGTAPQALPSITAAGASAGAALGAHPVQAEARRGLEHDPGAPRGPCLRQPTSTRSGCGEKAGFIARGLRGRSSSRSCASRLRARSRSSVRSGVERQRDRRRRDRLLHVVLSRHAAHRPAFPDLPRAPRRSARCSAIRGSTS